MAVPESQLDKTIEKQAQRASRLFLASLRFFNSPEKE
jgi:hypothetical protein